MTTSSIQILTATAAEFASLEAAPRKGGTLLPAFRRLACLFAGHDWWIDISPCRRADAMMCSRCGCEKAY